VGARACSQWARASFTRTVTAWLTSPGRQSEPHRDPCRAGASSAVAGAFDERLPGGANSIARRGAAGGGLGRGRRRPLPGRARQSPVAPSRPARERGMPNTDRTLRPRASTRTREATVVASSAISSSATAVRIAAIPSAAYPKPAWSATIVVVAVITATAGTGRDAVRIHAARSFGANSSGVTACLGARREPFGCRNQPTRAAATPTASPAKGGSHTRISSDHVVPTLLQQKGRRGDVSNTEIPRAYTGIRNRRLRQRGELDRRPDRRDGGGQHEHDECEPLHDPIGALTAHGRHPSRGMRSHQVTGRGPERSGRARGSRSEGTPTARRRRSPQHRDHAAFQPALPHADSGRREAPCAD